MKTQYFGALLLLLGACSGETTGGESSTANELDAKRQAANDVASGAAQGDVCATNDWYGDGVCDTFCGDADTDCVPDGSGEPTVCAAFAEVEDGVCGRAADDPCLFQDPDCDGGGVDPVDPDEPVACALFVEEANDVCSRAADDPCRFQDPDCAGGGGGGGGYNCDLSQVSCERAEPTCPDGQVPTAIGYCYGACVPVEQCAVNGCPAIAMLPDGVCEERPNDPCWSDPDCGVACAEYIEEPDGVCSREPTDPCISQDPDCGSGVICAEYIEEPNGVCSREPNDPCISQDPDCTAP